MMRVADFRAAFLSLAFFEPSEGVMYVRCNTFQALCDVGNLKRGLNAFSRRILDEIERPQRSWRPGPRSTVDDLVGVEGRPVHQICIEPVRHSLVSLRGPPGVELGLLISARPHPPVWTL